MTAPNLNPEQRERVNAGKCACGCGEDRDAPSAYAGQGDDSRRKHRQKAYRERRQTGHVLSPEEHERRRMIAKAEEHDREAARLRAWAKRSNAEARINERAAQRLREAAATLPLPFAQRGRE